MSQNNKTTPIIVALIGAGASLLLGYLQFCRNPDVPPVVAPEQRQFTGRVIDAESGNKIRGATVSLEIRGVPPVLYTDSEGIFSFSLKNAPETVRLVIEAKDYQKYDRRVDVDTSSSVEEIHLTREPADTPDPQSTPAGRTTSRPSTPDGKDGVLGRATKSIPYAAATKSINEKSSAQFFDDQVTIAVGLCDNDQPVTLTVIATGAPKVCSNIASMAETQCKFKLKNHTYGVMVTAVGESSATVAVYPLET